MSQTHLLICPPYAHAIRDAEGNLLNKGTAPVWSGKNAPPVLGSRVTITMNGLGDAVVTGYCVVEEWLGLHVRLEAAPEWHKRQNKGDPNGVVFGAEVKY